MADDDEVIPLRRRATAKKIRRRNTAVLPDELSSPSPSSGREETPGRVDTLDEDEIEDIDVLNGLVGGCIAGSLADVLMHPFDTINIRQKVMRKPTFAYRSTLLTALTIVQTEGHRGLFRGVGASAISALPSNAVYFGTYETIKKQSRALDVNGDYKYLTYMFAGAMSELTSSILYHPFEMVKCRMQTGSVPVEGTANFLMGSEHANYNSVFNAFLTVVRQDGVAGLYTGYKAAIMTDMGFSAFQWMFYESLKEKTKERMQLDRHLNDKETLVIGGFAGGVAGFLTNPLDTVTARLVTQGQVGTSGHQYDGVLHCINMMARTEGIESLWQGWQPRVIRFSLIAGVTFTVYEKVKLFLRWSSGEDEEEEGRSGRHPREK
jgi:hypothetical protein